MRAAMVAALSRNVPFDVMKLTLTFEGQLPSSGNGSKKLAKKWETRHAFHHQLSELWRVNDVLKHMAAVTVPLGGFTMIEQHHSEPHEDFARDDGGERLWLYEPINKHGRNFIPLVRDSMALTCALDILFLRKEEPGKIVQQGGDIDNRLKTLIDGLRMPMHVEEMAESEAMPDLMYCLLESGTLISDMRIRTDRLLTSPQGNPKEARLVVEVTAKALRATTYNLPMMGH